MLRFIANRQFFSFVLGFVALILCSTANAKKTCDDGTLNGTYSFSEEGTIYIPLGPPPNSPVAQVKDVEIGKLTFLGNGEFSGEIFRLSFSSDVAIFNGEYFSVLDNVELTDGVFEINEDCTGIATFMVDIGFGPQERGIHLVVSNKRGREFRFISSSPGNALSGFAKKQKP